MSNEDLLFFTVATNGYEAFIPTFILFASKTNPNSKFEFVVKNPDKMNCVKEWFPNVPIKFRKIPEEYKNTPHGTRFALEPETKCKYTYISDVDIMITENIIDFHVNRMKETGLPFDNAVRLGKELLSGLHFVETDKYYPQVREVQKEFMDIINLDEHYLYWICKDIWDLSKVTPNSEDEFWLYRPIHGIHISPTRLLGGFKNAN